MQYKLVRAILHTGGKDLEWFKKRQADEKKKGVICLYEPTVEDAKAMVALMDAFDGIEIIAFKSDESGCTKGYYDFVGWNDLAEANNQKMKEIGYLVEQDPDYGNYINNRTQFDKDWAEGTYELGDGFHPWFDPEDLEILEVFH